MTTDLEERREYWKNRHPYTFRNWRVLARNRYYDDAAAIEREAATRGGCVAESGGPRIPGPVWSVYRFEY